MSVSRRVIHHGLYFAVLGPLIGVLFLVLVSVNGAPY